MSAEGDRDGNPAPLSRRRFLAGAVAAVVVASCSEDGDPTGDPTGVPGNGSEPPTDAAPTSSGSPDTTTGVTPTLPPLGPPLPEDPFTIGVASGDPTDTSVILWTRLLPATAALTGDVPVGWEVAEDEGFATVLAAGVIAATPAAAHSVHVDAAGLPADRVLWYRFTAGGHRSPVGRTRTAPAAGASSGDLRFAMASCQHWERGHWAAWRDVVEQDVDLVVFLGDYIYETGPADAPAIPDRIHLGGPLRSLDDYRARYAQYRTDPLLRAAHAHCPWVVTWDDHEVANDYAGAAAEDGTAVYAFLERRAAAYRAWYEHMPVRLPAPTGPDFPIHRTVRFGDLLHLWVLDTRQYRDDQVIEDTGLPDVPGAGALTAQGGAVLDPERTILGEEQRRWLVEGAGTSTARWTAIAQQVYMFGASLLPGADPPVVVADTWDGYPADRERVLDAFGGNPSTDYVVLTGDFHAAAVADLRPRPFDQGSPVVATELMAAGISSDFPDEATTLASVAFRLNDQVRTFEPTRGYTLCEVSADRWDAAIRVVADPTDPAAAVRTASRWRIAAGTPGAARL